MHERLDVVPPRVPPRQDGFVRLLGPRRRHLVVDEVKEPAVEDVGHPGEAVVDAIVCADMVKLGGLSHHGEYV